MNVISSYKNLIRDSNINNDSIEINDIFTRVCLIILDLRYIKNDAIIPCNNIKNLLLKNNILT